MTTEIQAIPILLTPDIAATSVWARALGFDVEPFGDYAILRGHGVELHYSQTDRPEACSQTSCYLRGGGVPAVYRTLSGMTLPEGMRMSDLQVRPWGMTEFYLWDPHGNLLKFGLSTDEYEGEG